MDNANGALIVSWDFSNGDDSAFMLVGHKKPGEDVKVINVFQGQEALDIYKKLTTKKGE